MASLDELYGGGGQNAPAGPPVAPGATIDPATGQPPVEVGIGVQGGPAASLGSVPSPDAFRTDVIGKIKAGLLSPFGGGGLNLDPQTGMPSADVYSPSGTAKVIGSIGDVLLPGSWEEVATQAALGLPGRGLASSLSRGLAATTAPAAVAAVKGEDPFRAGALGAMTAAVAEPLGGIARAAVRGTASALGTPADTRSLGKIMGDLIPEFRGNTPRETIQNVIEGTGRRRLQNTFHQAEGRMIDSIPGGVVRVEALEQLGVPRLRPIMALNAQGRPVPVPGMYDAREAINAIRGLEESLAAGGGGRGTNVEALLIRRARDEFMAQVPDTAPSAGGLSPRAAYNEARNHFRRGMDFVRLLGLGAEDITPEIQARIIPPGRHARSGNLNWEELQRSYQTQRGQFAESMPGHLRDIDAVMRFRPNLQRDVAGVSPSIGATTSGGIPRPWFGGRFRTPTRTGAGEDIAGIGAFLTREGAGRMVGSKIQPERTSPPPEPPAPEQFGPPTPQLSEYERARNWWLGVANPPRGELTAPVPRPFWPRPSGMP